MSKGFKDYTPDKLSGILQSAHMIAYQFQRRRHDQWDANYTLYRQQPQINRLTQSQSVCLPLMKATISTVLSTINQPPVIRFYANDNAGDEDYAQKEIDFNGLWAELWNRWHGQIVDRADKKNCALYGRGIKIITVKNGTPTIRAIDPYDLLVDPGTDPVDVDGTANYLIHANIKETKWEIENNPWFDQTEVEKCLSGFDGLEGGQTDYTIEGQAKNRRIQYLGYGLSSEHALTEIVRKDFYYRLYSEEKGKQIIYWIPCIDDRPIACLPLEDVIGHTADSYWDDHFPITTWTDDPDPIDFWSDGVADTVRSSHRLINMWWSQEVENRTLKNQSMFFYNSSINPEFIPQTFDPYPWAFYPVPGNPAEMMMQVPVPDLASVLDQIAWVKNMVQEATAATATMQGATERSKVTLGEVELAVGNAQARIQSMTPYYSQAWHETAEKLYKVIEGGVSNGYLETITATKQGAKGNSFMRSISYKDLVTPHGYTIEAVPANIDEEQTVDELQKLNVAIQVMPENPALKRIYKEKVIDSIGLTAEQKNEIKEAEEQAVAMQEQELAEQAQMQQEMQQQAAGMQPMQAPVPQEQVAPMEGSV